MSPVVAAFNQHFLPACRAPISTPCPPARPGVVPLFADTPLRAKCPRNDGSVFELSASNTFGLPYPVINDTERSREIDTPAAGRIAIQRVFYWLHDGPALTDSSPGNGTIADTRSFFSPRAVLPTEWISSRRRIITRRRAGKYELNK